MISKIKTTVIAALGLFFVAGITQASAATVNLQGDFTAQTFWLISMAMVASTAFFFLERDRVAAKWKTSLTLAGIVTGVAAWHYMYMRGYWVENQSSPVVLRYVDWLITVPILMVEFYIILKAVTNVSSAVFWKLLIASTIMLVFGYMGESGMMNVMTAFVIGMAAWLYMIYEIFAGEAGQASANSGNGPAQTAFNALRLIVTVGWAIYPIGYAVGYFGGGIDAGSLNVIYNFADFVNKIAFGLIIYVAATADSNA